MEDHLFAYVAQGLANSSLPVKDSQNESEIQKYYNLTDAELAAAKIIQAKASRYFQNRIADTRLLSTIRAKHITAYLTRCPTESMAYAAWLAKYGHIVDSLNAHTSVSGLLGAFSMTVLDSAEKMLPDIFNEINAGKQLLKPQAFELLTFCNAYQAVRDVRFLNLAKQLSEQADPQKFLEGLYAPDLINQAYENLRLAEGQLSFNSAGALLSYCDSQLTIAESSTQPPLKIQRLESK